ncbi:MAG: AAA family ATPase [Coriobacteriia bacterium]
MIRTIELENFKAQRQSTVELGKFSVLTGYNAAGKTTILQALVFLKQSLSRKEITYNDYLLKLGDFRELVHTHDQSLPVRIKVAFEFDGKEVAYAVEVARIGTAEAFFVNGERVWSWDTRNPAALEPSGRLFLPQAALGYGGGEYTASTQEQMLEIRAAQKRVVDWFDNMLYLSSSRGFTKYSYPLLAGQPETDEVAKRAGDASLLEEWLSNLIMYRINEAQRYPQLRAQLDVMKERLSRVGVDINPYVMGGPSVVIDLSEGDMWVSAVNSGYGINQLVSFVALGTLLPEGTLIAVEEPEIHLHPRMQRTVCKILTEIAEDGKQVVITSHSDHFLSTLAADVEYGLLSADDLKVYHFRKQGRATEADELNVLDKQAVRGIFC